MRRQPSDRGRCRRSVTDVRVLPISQTRRALNECPHGRRSVCPSVRSSNLLYPFLRPSLGQVGVFTRLSTATLFGHCLVCRRARGHRPVRPRDSSSVAGLFVIKFSATTSVGGRRPTVRMMSHRRSDGAEFTSSCRTSSCTSVLCACASGGAPSDRPDRRTECAERARRNTSNVRNRLRLFATRLSAANTIARLRTSRR